jgi:hypothetical protein
MMTAKQKFEKGDRVRLTVAGYNQFRHRRMKSDEGIVAGSCRDPELVKVIVDGIKTVEWYHADFWEKI